MGALEQITISAIVREQAITRSQRLKAQLKLKRSGNDKHHKADST